MASKFLKNWKKPAVNRLMGFVLVVAGLVTIVAGFGAWKNPHLDWEIFKAAFSSVFASIKEEINRVFDDPFALIGLILMIAGFVAAINGIKKLYSKHEFVIAL